jgi:hypothetical protein
MQLPFSRDAFLAVFRAYNAAIGIAPFALVFLAVALIVLAHTKVTWRHRAITTGLGAFWVWSGVVYHWGFFARINPAARLFGAVFLVQGIILLTYALREPLRFAPRAWGTGWVLIVYALIVYPLLGYASGHGYPGGPSFGAPCPVTIFFLGMMLWTQDRPPVSVIAIPVVWACVGTSAAMQLGMREDLGLTAAAALVVIDAIRRRPVSAVRMPSVAR